MTICTQNRECLFGDVMDGEMVLNDAGHVVQTVWDEMHVNYPGVETDEFVIIPNHIHGIVVLVGAGPRACPDNGQPQDVGQPQGVAPTGMLSLPDVGATTGVAHSCKISMNGVFWAKHSFRSPIS